MQQFTRSDLSRTPQQTFSPLFFFSKLYWGVNSGESPSEAMAHVYSVQSRQQRSAPRTLAY